jgi:hypothetical protein
MPETEHATAASRAREAPEGQFLALAALAEAP